MRSNLKHGHYRLIALLLGLMPALAWLLLHLADAQSEQITPDARLANLLAASKVADQLDAPLTPTDDPLFDRYAAEVLQRVQDAPTVDLLTLTNELSQGMELGDLPWFLRFQPAKVPDDILATWEPDFGDDVRYWELRYYCALPVAEIPYYTANSCEAEAPPEDFLREAKRRGLATWNTLALLYPAERRRIEDEFDTWLKLHALEDVRATPGLVERLQQLEQAELALLDEIRAAAPDQAWPYVMRARFDANLGEWDQVVSDIQAACAAPQAYFPTPFPMQDVMDGVQQGQPRGNAVLSGAIIMGNPLEPMFELIKFKEMAKEAEVMSSLGGDPQYLDASNQLGCRIADCQPVSLARALAGEVICQLCFSYLENEPVFPLTAAQLDTLQRIRGLTALYRAPAEPSISRMLKYTQQLSLDFYNQISAEQEVLGPHALWLDYYLNTEQEIRVFETELAPKLAILRQVRIPELSAPPGLEEFEPVPADPSQPGT